MKNCMCCGSEVSDDVIHCPKCGFPIKEYEERTKNLNKEEDDKKKLLERKKKTRFFVKLFFVIYFIGLIITFIIIWTR